MVRSTCPGLSGRPWCVAFSCNGATLACGVMDGGVTLFDTRRGSKKLELPGALYFAKLVFSIPRALFSCLSLVCSSCIPLCAFPPLCSPPALFRVQFLRSSYKQRSARLCGLYLLAPPLPLTPLSPIRSLRMFLPRPGLLSRRRQSAGLLQWSGGACVGPAL
jgi:hypothetical protein